MEAVDSLIGTFTDDFGRAVAHGAAYAFRRCETRLWRALLTRLHAAQCARRSAASATRRWASWTRRALSWSRRVTPQCKRTRLRCQCVFAFLRVRSRVRPQARAALSAERERFEAQRSSERAELDRAWQARGRLARNPPFSRRVACSPRKPAFPGADACFAQELYECRDRDAALRGAAEAAVADAASARAAAAYASADAEQARRAAAASFAAAAYAPPPPPPVPHAAPPGRPVAGGASGPSPPPPAPATLFAIGGLSRSAEPLASCEAFDPAAGAWYPLPPLSVPRGYCAAAAAGGGGRRGGATLYAIGGSRGGAPTDSCEALAPGGATWRPIAAMGTPRVWHAAATVRDAVIVVGGYDGAKALAAAEAFAPDVDAPRGLWRPLAVCVAACLVFVFMS